jgi:hypothetical protein
MKLAALGSCLGLCGCSYIPTPPASCHDCSTKWGPPILDTVWAASEIAELVALGVAGDALYRELGTDEQTVEVGVIVAAVFGGVFGTIALSSAAWGYSQVAACRGRRDDAATRSVPDSRTALGAKALSDAASAARTRHCVRRFAPATGSCARLKSTHIVGSDDPADWEHRFKELRRALEERLGDLSNSATELPDQCADPERFVACLRSGEARAWVRWSDGMLPRATPCFSKWRATSRTAQRSSS